jgi:hypothetical protein
MITFRRSEELAMERTEFLRRQAERCSQLAADCTDREVREQLLRMAKEYTDLLKADGHSEPRVPSESRH